MPFQRQCWKACLEGRDGLIKVPTGAGKTYAAVMGPIARMLACPGAGVRLLYLTPLRALSSDLALAIRAPIEAMDWPLRVGIRNGDTASAERSRQLRQPPQILQQLLPRRLQLLLRCHLQPPLLLRPRRPLLPPSQSQHRRRRPRNYFQGRWRKRKG